MKFEPRTLLVETSGVYFSRVFPLASTERSRNASSHVTLLKHKTSEICQRANARISEL
jgi:hypothetical protein